ncbi:DUF4468 domain-containing protein [Halomonadaceae bacterium KBTZ08]
MNLARLMLILVVLVIAGCVSRPTPEQMKMQNVHQVDLSKEEIFDQSQEWMSEVFVDSKEVIELANPDTGTIIGKGMTKVYLMDMYETPARFTMRVDIKDGKYRTTYDDWTGMYGEYNNEPRPLSTKNQVDQLEKGLRKMDQELLEYLKSGGSSDDW